MRNGHRHHSKVCATLLRKICKTMMQLLLNPAQSLLIQLSASIEGERETLLLDVQARSDSV